MYHFEYYLDRTNKDYFYDIKYLLDQRIYHYGLHFLGNNDINNLQLIKRHVKNEFRFYTSFLNNRKYNGSKPACISNGYFNLEKHIRGLDIEPLPVPWKNRIDSWRVFRKLYQSNFRFETATYWELSTEEMFELWKSSLDDLINLYDRLKAKFLIIPNDLSLFERLSIKAFNKLKAHSFLFSHGLPARYNLIDDNQTDYLVVWGSAIKQNYISAGFNSSKILISGNPKYGSYNLGNISISGNMSRVLVLSKAMNGAQHSGNIVISDRGNMIYYLNTVMKVLKKNGVKTAFFRPHPSENIQWYYKYIDSSFYKPDTNSDISQSLKMASCIIGPISTCVIDAIFSGKQYYMYEPKQGEKDCLGNSIVPPFDKSDYRVPVASSAEELEENIRTQKCIKKDILKDYVNERFDISFLQQYS